MRRAPCVAFFCDAFFCIRLTTRVPQNSMNSRGFLVSTGSRDRNGSNSHRPTHINTRPGRSGAWQALAASIAGAGCTGPSQARGASVHRRRGVHPSIAGAGCICRSRARAPLRSRIAAVQGSAVQPMQILHQGLAQRAGAGVAVARVAACPHGSARDSCNPRPQWSSPGPRSTVATRARDRRMHPAPAMDGCTPQAIGAGFAWTEQAVLTTLDAAHAVVLLPANALTCAGSACSDRTTSDRQGSGFAWTQQAAGVV